MTDRNCFLTLRASGRIAEGVTEGSKRPWPPLIKMDAAVKAKVEKLFGGVA